MPKEPAITYPGSIGPPGAAAPACEHLDGPYRRLVDEVRTLRERLALYERCPDWCDGPECDHPPRVGGACPPCGALHYATHIAQHEVPAL